MPKEDPAQNMNNDGPAEESLELSEASRETLIEKLNEADQKTNDYWERILRLQAEAENVARRNERAVENAHKFALEKFVNELIPIIDSLELSADNVPDDMKEAAKPILEGVDLTLKMFYSAMEKFGVEQVYPLNQPFDPEYSQAISTKPTPEVAPNTVVSVLQKGYTLNKRLIRPALVVVSKEEE